ncbi:LOW QUALITY PROTEIN: hypothetical protein Cgig2_007607 [Carnegiea gigantea]|uniref:Uncharacterized protein n=1 Tax=Carnegiea gigantea TaxID=171969 RepID=A0A9Q1JUL6_9CARY|nr:LOW QUALITY PROTEIN: hypothetical protein Cgig2_007607 [Carnegiea gigantea]
MEISLSTKCKLGFAQCLLDLQMIKPKVTSGMRFLNGIDDVYGPQRNKIPLMNPLPDMKIAYNLLQQEELQEEVLDVNKIIAEPATLLSKMSNEKCSYPSWCPKFGKQPQNQHGREIRQQRSFRSEENTPWRGATQAERAVTKTHLCINTASVPTLTTQQIQQLIKLLPQSGGGRATSKYQFETDEEIDTLFTSNVSCLSSIFSKGKWY